MDQLAPPKDRTTLWAALGYAAVIAVLFHRLLLGEVLSPAANLWVEVPFRGEVRENLTPYLNGIQGDVWRACEAWHIHQYHSAREGRFPLWNSHVLGGFPFHANAQAAMLSPFHWVFFVVDPKWAGGPVAAAKLWIAGFVTFLLARRLGMIASGAFLAGTTWMLSAFVVRWLLWNLATTAVLLPVVLLAMDGIIVRPSLRRVALAGLATTTLQLSGHPECQFLVAALSGLFVLVRVALQPVSWLARFARVLECLAAQVLGAAGAAVALLPFLDQLSGSVDWHESTHALAGRHLPVEVAAAAVAPDVFGRPRAGWIYDGPINYIETGLYIGLVPLALAGAALVALLIRPRRTAAAPTGAAVVIFAVWVFVCGAVVFGVSGVESLVRRLPLFSKSDTLRLLLGLHFGGAMLAGSAWTQWVTNRDRVIGAVWPLAACGVASVAAWLFVSPMKHGQHWDPFRRVMSDHSPLAPFDDHALRAKEAVGVAAFAALVTFIVVVRTRRSVLPTIARWVAPLVIAVTLGDLGWVAYGFNPIVPARFIFPEPPAALESVIQRAGAGRIVATDEILSPNTALVYGFRDLRGYDFPLDLRTARLFQRLGWPVGNTLVPRDQFVPCIRPAVQSVCDKCAVRLLYTNVRRDALPVCDRPREANDSAEPRESASRAWPLVQSGPAEDGVYENPTAYPRAYFARRVAVTWADAALAALLDPDHDFRRESFLEIEPPELHEIDADALAGEVTIERDAAEEVVLRTRSDRAALVVLADRFEKNWQVEIDGRPARPLRANYLFRGVVVPVGEHVVRWVYRPASLIWGACGSLVALVLMLACIAWPAPNRANAAAN